MLKFAQLKKYLPVGTLGVSLILHLAIFLGISGVILIQAVAPKVPFTPAQDSSAADAQELPPEPDLSPEEPLPLTDNALPDNSAPSSEVTPFVDTIASSAPSISPMVMVPSVSSGAAGGAPGAAATGATGKRTGTPRFNPFGSADPLSGGGLVGYFYDLKEDKNGKGNGMDLAKWREVATKFANSKTWDPAQFDAYYKSPNPLYVKKFFISTRASGEAPQAFNVPNKPAQWLILYQGTVIPPENGTYSFVGYGDDLLIIRVNNKLVLDAGWITLTPDAHEQKRLPNLWSAKLGKQGLLFVGKSFTAKAGEPLKLDILIGDQGGLCAYFLMLMKSGVGYEKLKDGTPRLPLFQLDDSPTEPEGDEYPPFSTTAAPWKSAP